MRLYRSKILIKFWLRWHGIKYYKLIPDTEYGFVVNVAGHVDLDKKKLEFIPVKFNIVGGFFSCSNNSLTTLKGCPISVSGDFYCYNNQLTSLFGVPTLVGGEFCCFNNQLTSLEYCPTSVDRHFFCSHNQLTSLEYCPTSVGGVFDCSYNELVDLKHLPTSVVGKFDCGSNILLGNYQDISTLSQIKDKITSDNEKRCLSKTLELGKKSAIQKL